MILRLSGGIRQEVQAVHGKMYVHIKKSGKKSVSFTVNSITVAFYGTGFCDGLYLIIVIHQNIRHYTVKSFRQFRNESAIPE